MISKSSLQGAKERGSSAEPLQAQGYPAVPEGLWALEVGDALDLAEVYQGDRVVFNQELAAFIEKCVSHADIVGIRLADILTSQYVLPEIVVSKGKFTKIAYRLSKSFMGLDNLLILGGFLDEKDLNYLVDNLPEGYSSSDKEGIKQAARQTNNILMFNETNIGDTNDTDANRSFKRAVKRARITNRVVGYEADMFGGPKIFLKKESEERVAMVRRMDVENFAAWLKAYEAGQIWSELGFDYTPVESISRFISSGQTGTVDVRTVLLESESLAEAYAGGDSATREQLMAQAEAIKQGLDKIGVRHGHLHPDNIQVVTHDGKPRIFVIDFDKALIAKP